MNGTDELRKWGYGFCGDTHDVVTAIADRIDAEHKKVVASVMNDALYHANEKDMAKLGWYRALDADKQPIKFGEEVEHNGVVANVLGITFHGTTPPTVCIVRGDCWVEADELRHYHAPTVEDVLREFAQKMNENMGMYTGEAIDADEWRQADAKTVAEYAAKLRLLAKEEDA